MNPTPDFMNTLRETHYPHLQSVTYLDYTASTPYPVHLPRTHIKTLQENLYSNPHSTSPSSALSTEAINSTTNQILDFFNASKYSLIYTSNASNAAKLLAESFPFRRGSRLILSKDNHNSVIGIRTYATANHAKVAYLPLDHDFRIVDIPLPRARKPSLVAYPAQSNFTGVRHTQNILQNAHQAGYYVLLDASAYVPTSKLDLSKTSADFIIISFYKMFGYPTGIGALLVNNTAIDMLSKNRPSFSGGTVDWVTTNPERHALLPGADGFHDGTPDFLGIPALVNGFAYLNRVGMPVITNWVAHLTTLLIEGLIAIKDDFGRRLIQIYGPESSVNRGGTIAFDVIVAGRRVVADTVADELASLGICVRSGCFCNPGCGEHALLRGRRLYSCVKDGVTKRELSQCLGKGLAFVRVSVGLGAVENDVTIFLKALSEFCEKVLHGDVNDPFWDVEEPSVPAGRIGRIQGNLGRKDLGRTLSCKTL